MPGLLLGEGDEGVRLHDAEGLKTGGEGRIAGIGVDYFTLSQSTMPEWGDVASSLRHVLLPRRTFVPLIACLPLFASAKIHPRHVLNRRSLLRLSSYMLLWFSEGGWWLLPSLLYPLLCAYRWCGWECACTGSSGGHLRFTGAHDRFQMLFDPLTVFMEYLGWNG